MSRTEAGRPDVVKKPRESERVMIQLARCRRRGFEPRKAQGILTGEAPLLCLEGVEDDESDQNKDDQTGDDDADHSGHGHGLC